MRPLSVASCTSTDTGETVRPPVCLWDVDAQSLDPLSAEDADEHGDDGSLTSTESGTDDSGGCSIVVTNNLGVDCLVSGRDLDDEIELANYNATRHRGVRIRSLEKLPPCRPPPLGPLPPPPIQPLPPVHFSEAPPPTQPMVIIYSSPSHPARAYSPVRPTTRLRDVSTPPFDIGGAPSRVISCNREVEKKPCRQKMLRQFLAYIELDGEVMKTQQIHVTGCLHQSTNNNTRDVKT
ncbi:hypothetical protein LXA43DRAFT_1061053 [Ganoderma leucocontextum]|nr:hypothetical protein LXA43DRAFT_1061053 [Ganoderma leucocontextum]